MEHRLKKTSIALITVVLFITVACLRIQSASAMRKPLVELAKEMFVGDQFIALDLVDYLFLESADVLCDGVSILGEAPPDFDPETLNLQSKYGGSIFYVWLSRPLEYKDNLELHMDLLYDRGERCSATWYKLDVFYPPRSTLELTPEPTPTLTPTSLPTQE